MQTATLSCPPSISAAAAPRALVEYRPTRSQPIGRNGDWHYHGVPPPSRIPWAAMLISAALHLILLFGFNHHAPAVKKVAKREPDLIQMTMPELKDLDEDPPPTDLEDESTKAPKVEVPTLIDLPSIVDVNVAFVQPLDLRVPVQTDINAANLAVIPVNLSTGTRTGTGLKDIFDLSQLDHQPEPISQVAPRFPPAMKRDVAHAEVSVGFIVDAEGTVERATVIESTNSGFNQAAVDGVSRWRFRPGTKAGRRVNTRMRVQIRFKVTETETS